MGGVDYRALAFEARDAFGRALQSLDAFPQLATQALLEHSPDGTLGWLFKTVVVLLISIVAGAAALTLTERWGTTGSWGPMISRRPVVLSGSAFCSPAPQ